MSEYTTGLIESAIKQACKTLRLPVIAGQSVRLAEEATREHQTYLGYLEALLTAEVEEREPGTRARVSIERRIKEAHLPRIKTLDEFDFAQAPDISAPRIHELAQGNYLDKAEPIVFIGDCGTGKTHLLTGLCVAACRQKRRVRFTTAAGLLNELVEAKQQLQVRRVLARWARYDLIAIDEVGYVPLAEVGAEFLFQVIAERAEQTAVSCSLMGPRQRASAGVGVVTRTISQPAPTRRSIWATVAEMSLVSVVVIDWARIGLSPPTPTSPTITTRVGRRR